MKYFCAIAKPSRVSSASFTMIARSCFTCGSVSAASFVRSVASAVSTSFFARSRKPGVRSVIASS